MIDPETLEQVAARRIEAIVIGASAGGFEALLRVLSPLPADYALPVAIVVHLPEQHDSRLAELFDYRIAPRAREARDKATLEPGTVYFAPAGYHLLIEKERSFALSLEDRVNYARPAIDVLMLTAADAYGPALCGIVLTGANADGAAGLAGIRLAGGLAIVQDPRDAQADTMPRAAIAQARPDLVLPLTDIGTLLLALGRPTT